MRAIKSLSEYAFVGYGSFNAVFRDGNTVLKIGNTTQDDFNMFRRLAGLGLAPDPIAYYPNVDISAVVNTPCGSNSLNKYTLWFGSPNVKIANVMVMPYVLPLRMRMKRSMRYSDFRYTITDRAADRLCKYLSDKIYKLTGFLWYDYHTGNVGIYNDRAVVIDLN